ncbi:MAG TPA: TIGR03435 family protein, partial [Acidobacteriaceae bacterium]
MATGTLQRLFFVTLATLAAAAAAPTHAQILHSTDPLPAFEVTTVKPRDPKAMMTPLGSQNIVRYAGQTRMLIAIAYNLPTTSLQRIVGGPDWIDDNKKWYVLEGKIPDSLFTQMQKQPGNERHQQACLMMQAALAERFHLKVHFETLVMPVYELTIAKGGAKLPAPNDATVMGGGEILTKDGLRIHNMTLDGMLTAPWFGLGGRPIVNKTGLAGSYNLELHDWHPELPSQGPSSLAPPPEGQASIFTVLQEQLGVKLAPAKAPAEVVVID